ncbi:TonB-dependent siderophore receptor [Altericroceibacterium endophyticum]|uniref:TonB-dependent siderophore receptor n=1 Tax=Altericroceibacterium endophyticum TaxID=1808508 RepID=A0A6I4T7I6_9SPHN|nr:TonB-dependent siderophore receptor [Altericroceibacterium endophyticum]MXO66212.1 TonB-dependent siderophore receptor [Altericroceibacterium endophyticum]
MTARLFLTAAIPAIVLAAAASPAVAQVRPVSDSTERPGDDAAIIVSGVRQAYRGNFALTEIPQSIDVIDAAELDSNGIDRLNDALDLNASVARQNTLGGMWDAFAIRGFAGDENIPTGYLVNGFNGGRGFGGERDTAGIERIEVLKGPAAALLGRGEPGGTINIVTKQAQLGRTFGTFSGEYGSFDRVRGEGDVNIALGDNVTARLIGYYEHGNSFRDTVDETRWGFLPSIGIALGSNTRLTYDLEKTRVERPFDRGIVVLNGDFETVPRSRYLGEPGDGDHIARAEGHQLRLQHDFSDRWSLLLGASHRDTLLTGTSSDPELAGSRQPIFTDGRSLSRQRRSRLYDSRQKVVRGELSGEFATAGLTHRVLIGADHDEFDNYQDFRRVRPPSLASNPTEEEAYIIDIFDPVYGRFPLPTPLPNNDRLDKQSSTGIFVQDQIELTDKLQVRVGARYDDFTLRTENYLTDITTQRDDDRISPQAGIVYELAPEVTLYAAYSEGFRANLGTDVNGAIFDPETSRSFETGAKLMLLDGAITGTFTLYQLEKDNVLASDTNNPGFNVTIGKARSRGVELDLNGRLPGNVDVLLSYAYVDAESRSSVLDPNFSFNIEPGDPLINIPKNTLDLQASKAFAVAGRDAKLGAGMHYVGKRLGATGTDFFLPDHTLFRVFGEVDLLDNLTFYGSVKNLFNAHWYANSYNELWVQPGAPRTASIGLRAGF